MTHSDFRLELEKLIGKSTTLRPFVCDGYPLNCDVFIVGINPATSMNAEYWDFWNGDKFNREKWFKHYLNERKDKHYKISPTRKKIEYLVKEVFSEHNCLETNAYSSATPNINLLSKEQRSTDILSFLIRTIKPKAMFVHGSDPANFIKNELGVKFLSSKPLVVHYETGNAVSAYVYEWTYGKTVICSTKHLRLTKQEEITKTAINLLEMMKKL